MCISWGQCVWGGCRVPQLREAPDSNWEDDESAMGGAEDVAEKVARFFKCSHCGAEIDGLHLVTFWNGV
jgi:hypothetical protein